VFVAALNGYMEGQERARAARWFEKSQPPHENHLYASQLFYALNESTEMIFFPSSSCSLPD